MSTALRIITKFDNILSRIEAVVLISIVMIMTTVIFLQVVYRYILTQPLYWSEELARYLFVWLSIIGATLALQKRGHFRLDILFRALPKQVKPYMRFLIHFLMGAVVFVILIQGIMLVQKTFLQESPAMGISMAWAYASLPVGGALMALHLLVIFLKDWNSGRLE